MTLAGDLLGGAAAALGKRAVDAALGNRKDGPDRRRTARKKKGAPRMGKKGKKGQKPHAAVATAAPRKSTEDRIAKALVGLRRSSSADPALDDFREDLFAELRKLIRPAIGQAKKGKPALLRILTRYSR
jgi:hypothetical protein